MHRDLPVALPVCWTARDGPNGLRYESWEAVRPHGARALLSWLASTRGRPHAQAIEAAARLLAETLARGLMVRNIAADRLHITQAPDGTPLAHWLGIETVALRRPASIAAAAWFIGKLAESALGQAHISRCDRARFLRAFCRRTGCSWRNAWPRMPLDPI
jgi:hypothetical protein